MRKNQPVSNYRTIILLSTQSLFQIEEKNEILRK